VINKHTEPPEFDFNSVFDDELYPLFWDEHTSDAESDKQVTFLRREFELDKPLRILDIPCGFGRHSVRLAGDGHQVVGIDLNPGFIQRARKSAYDEGVDVDFRLGDMREIEFFEDFDRAIMLFTSIGYFADEENLKILKKVAQAIKPGGLFCLDTLNRDAVAGFFNGYNVTERGSALAVDRCSFDPVNGWIINRRVVFQGGVRKETPFFTRIYNACEMRDLLRKAGFRDLRFFGDWESSPLTLDSKRLIVIADK
jgi:SAM-dependent methyltransferase